MIEPNDTALRLFEILSASGIEAYAVGGFVRDSLMGAPVHDIDFAVSSSPEETAKCLAPYAKIVDTGSEFGTVTAVFGGTPFELTAFRADCGIKDGRHPQSVRFVVDIASDLSRRDFTVNAMAWSPEKGLVDPFGGREDIEKRLIRCVGQPSLRFEEDALRILRALRFASRLGFRIDDETAKALRRNAFRLKSISRERVFSELSGIICGKNAAATVTEYADVISVALPGLCAGGVFMLKRLPDELHLRFAALFKNADDAEKGMLSLKSPRRLRERVVALRRLIPLPEDERELLMLGIDNPPELLREASYWNLTGKTADIIDRFCMQNAFVSSKNLGISTQKIMEITHENGARLGTLIRELCTAVVNGECENTEAGLEKYLLSHSSHRSTQ